MQPLATVQNVRVGRHRHAVGLVDDAPRGLAFRRADGAEARAHRLRARHELDEPVHSEQRHHVLGDDVVGDRGEEEGLRLFLALAGARGAGFRRLGDRAGRFAAGAAFGFLAGLARRAGFAGLAALDLAVFFVLRGGIVSTGAGRADIACERN